MCVGLVILAGLSWSARLVRHTGPGTSRPAGARGLKRFVHSYSYCFGRASRPFFFLPPPGCPIRLKRGSCAIALRMASMVRFTALATVPCVTCSLAAIA